MFGSTTWGNNNQQQQQQPQQGGLFGNTGGGTFGQPQQPAAGGFGQAQNTGFGQPQQNSGGIFGSNTGQTNTGGFGSNTGFGQTAQSNTGFGAPRPSYGATGTPFGQANQSTTGGLFGSASNNSTTFGNTANASTSGGLFGQQPSQPFGSTPTNTFGTNSNAGNVQHGVATSEVHAYNPGPYPPPPPQGTLTPLYQPTWQRDPPPGPNRPTPLPHLFHVITAMDAYKGASFEELRALDYQQNRKQPTSQSQNAPPGSATTAFGQTPATTSFGAQSSFSQQPAASTSGFGAPKPAGGLFGNTNTTGNAFGSTPSTGGFGSTTTSGGLFGRPAATNTTNTFGQSNTGGGLFGQNNNAQSQSTPSGGLFGSTNTFGQNNQAQQQTGASTGFGGFGAAKPAFGAAPATTGFGSAPASTGFGQTNTGTSNTFGGFGTQTQTPATGGLFGSSATSGFGQTNNNTFGQNNANQAQPAQSGGLFGNTAPKPAGGLFGSTTASTTTPAFGGFGSTNNAAPSTGGLFGSQNNAQGATASPFGQQQNTTQTAPASGGLFGGATNTGGGLFGSKPAAPAAGSLFGSTNNTQSAPQAGGFGGFGSLGSTSTPATGGLFGSSNTNNNAAAAPKAPTFGGLFGSNQQQTQTPAQTGTTGGLFANLNQSQNNNSTGGGLFSSTTQPAQQSTLGQSGGLFGGSLAQSNNNTNNLQQQSMSASLDQNPYGRNDLFAYNGQKLELGSTNKKPALPPLTASSYRMTPTKGRLTKLRGFASSVNLAQSANGRAPSPSVVTPSRSVLGSPAPSDRYKGLTDSALSPNAFIPRPSVKKINVAPPKNTLGGGDRLESVLGKSALRSSTNGSAPATPIISASVRSPSLAASTSRPIEDTPTRSKTPAADSMRVAVSERPLKRGDYWSRPKLEKLRMMSHDELRHLEHFTAGRKGFGQVEFLEPVDLTGLSSLGDLLGDVITVEDLELTVYPDESIKPPVGKGLNVPAEISLENVFARDKATRQPITDTKDPRYQRKLKRIQAIPDTEFISLDDQGVWTFRVEHFTTYGLGDSDDEEMEEEEAASAPSDFSSSMGSDADDDFLPTKGLHDGDATSEEDTSLDEEDEDSYDESVDLSTTEYDDSYEQQADWDKPIKAKLGSQGMQRLREMQSSFFSAQDNKSQRLNAADSQRAAVDKAARLLERKQFEAGFGEAEEEVAKLGDRAVKRASFGESSSPPQFRQPRKYAKVALADSFVEDNEGVRRDAGLALGRSFRCSWGPNGELVHFGKICAPGDKFASSPDATVYLQQVDLLAESAAAERLRAERLLKLLLEHTQVDVDDGVPLACTDTSIRFKQFAALFDASDRSHEANVWRLGQALFDEIDLRLPESTPDEVRQRVAEVRRKLALSKWLEDAVAPAVDADLAKAGDNRPAKVFALLTGNQLERAVQSALDGNDMRIATLVSQAGGPDRFREEVQQQLTEWTENKANALVGYDYRKLYAVLAGITDVSPGNPGPGQDAARDVIIAEGLDWKRAFGLYLWHGCQFEQGIADVLQTYNEALDSQHAPAPPLPPYLEKPDSANRWKMSSRPTDVLFNLMTMYSDMTVPLEQVLDARDSSPSPTDLRLPWHLYLLLSQALAKRDFSDREEANKDGVAYSALANNITESYAAQLEEEGLWTWAAYVLLHLELPEARQASLKALLFRHPEPTPSEKSFLVDKLRVPEAWLYEASAARLAAAGDAYGEYFDLIPAGLADRAQRTLTSVLAPEAVIRDDQTLLRRLCESLEPLQPTGWEYGGKLFLDFLDLVTRTKPLLHSVLRAGAHPDPREKAELAELAKNLPRVLQLLPALFPDKDNVQQVASLSDMLSGLHSLAGALYAADLAPRPPVSDLLVDKDRLHLLQRSATESFENSLKALTA